MVKNILFATDFLSNSNKALQYAVDLKNKYHARLVVLNVNEEFLNKEEMVMSRVDVNEVKKTNEQIALNAKKMFEKMLFEAGIKNTSDIKMVQRKGVASREIIKYANLIKSDFIIVGSNNRSKISELLIGSTARKVINSSKIPVLVVPFTN